MKRLLANKKLLFIIIIVVLLLVAAIALLLMKNSLFPPKEEIEEPPTPIEAPIQYALSSDVKFLALPAGNNALVYDLEVESMAERAMEIQAQEQAAHEESKSEAEEPPTGGEEPPVAEETPPTDGETPLTDGEESQTGGEEPQVDGEESPTGEEEPPEEEKEEEKAQLPLVAYRYEGMTDAAGMARAYVRLLTLEDMGFIYADQSLRDVEEEPDLDTENGTVYLIHRLPKEKGVEAQTIALRLVWQETDCEVTAELVPTTMTRRPETENGRPIGSQTVLTFSGAVDTIRSMHPSVLGLDGDSMENYYVYSRDGLVMINGQSCMRIDIYSREESVGTNVIAGNYFLSSDGLHLYVLDKEAQKVRELSMQ